LTDKTYNISESISPKPFVASKESIRKFILISHYGHLEAKMDVAVLRGRIASTLDQDADTRRRAELDLKAVSIPSKILFEFRL
jgi:hypothetical protein